MDQDEARNCIIEELIENHQKYVQFHFKHDPDKIKTFLSNSDDLVNEVMDFFHTRNYNKDVVDLLVQVSADALGLDVHIFQNNKGKIQMLKYSGGLASKPVYLKFTHNDLHPVGNHYDAVTLSDTNLRLLSAVAEKVEGKKATGKKETGNKIINNQVFHREVENPQVVNTQLVCIDREGNSITNTQEFHQKVINLSVTNKQVIQPKRDKETTPQPNFAVPPPAHHVITKDHVYDSQPLDLSQKGAPGLSPLDLTQSKENNNVGEVAEPCSNNQSTDSPLYNTEVPNEDQPEQIESPIVEDQENKENVEIYAPPTTSVGRGKYFPLHHYNDITPEKVNKIPGDIDGMVYYEVTTDDLKWKNDTSDLHYFAMSTTSKSGFPRGTTKIGTCTGSWLCPNDSCSFMATSHNRQRNRVNMKVDPKDRMERICELCDHFAVREGCGAKKYVQYYGDENIARVYHLGIHRCWKKFNQEELEEHVKTKNTKKTGDATELAVDEIGDRIAEGNFEQADRESTFYTDKRVLQRIFNKQDPTYGLDNNSFDAVAVVKMKSDIKDPFYIYKVNNGAANNTSDYIFKGSRIMAQVAIDMDVAGPENIMQKENAYFDTTFNRVYGFTSFGLWVYHPTMRKILRIACMDMRSENYRDIAIFFTLLNEILSEVKKEEGYKFNPRAFVCDESGSNHKAIEYIYGEQFTKERVFSCQWHFMSEMNKKKMQVGEELRDKFISLCHKICKEATTVGKYNLYKGRIDEIANLYPGIKASIEWWHVRRSHVFSAFRGGGLPGVNLSEPANSGWKALQLRKKSGGLLRLVHAAKKDVSTMYLQEKEMIKFNSNLGKSSGRGPSQAVRDARDHAKQMKVAEDFANMFQDEDALLEEAEEAWNPSQFIPKSTDKHKPPKSGPKSGEEPNRKRQKPQTKKELKKARKANAVIPDEAKIRQNILLATEVLDVCYADLLKEKEEMGMSKNKNPPVVIFTNGLGIHVCRGCTKKTITKEETSYPKNMVFHRKGVSGFYNKKTNQWFDQETNLHFHLDWRCLRRHDQTVEFRDIYMNDEVFQDLSRQQMVVLKEAALLKHIVLTKI